MLESWLTSNRSLEKWGGIFGDEIMAAAVFDGPLDHCHIVNSRGNGTSSVGELLPAAKQTPQPVYGNIGLLGDCR